MRIVTTANDPGCSWIQLRFHAVAILCLVVVGPLTAVTVAADELVPDSVNAAEPIPLRHEVSTSPLLLPDVDGSLTLDQLEAMALAANPTIGRAAAQVGAARGNWVQVGLRPNPNVGYSGQQLGSGGRAEQHGVVFSQEISTGGKLQLNRAVAEREILIAEQQLVAQRQRVLTDVRVAYFQVLVAQRQMELAEELIRVGDEGANAVDALFRVEEVGRVDVLQARLEVEQSQILLQDARNRYDAAWRGMAAVLGNPRLAPAPVAGDPTGPAAEIEFEATLARIHASSPEVSEAVAELDRAQAAVARARVQPVPNVSMQGLVNWQDNGIGGKPDGGVALTVPIPLFDRNQGAIQQAEREVAAARHAVGQVELDLHQRLAAVFETYANARNQVLRYREAILPAAEESLALTRKLYRAGESNYIGLLTVQRTFAQTHRNYLDAVLLLRTSEAEMEGLLLSGSLERRPGGEATAGARSLGRGG